MGKSRLALRVTATAHDAFADGAYFVALAPLADPGLVLPTIARTLDIGEVAAHSLLASLAGALRGKRLLLVLDNVEHLLVAASLVGDVLAACPGMTVLTTSRAALRLQGERLYRVSPLSVPRRTERLPVDALMRYEAAQLFSARAPSPTRRRRRSPRFVPGLTGCLWPLSLPPPGSAFCRRRPC